MVKEILIAVGLGVVAFLGLDGVNIVPILLLMALAAVLMFSGVLSRIHPMGGRRQRTPAGAPVSFDEIGGQKTAKQELMEALEFLLQPDRMASLGIRPLKGILLTGPPGTGKTLLAKAAAHYTQSAFLTASGSEFVEMYAGVGAQRVRQLFSEARATARREGKGSAIIFIDEIEVMAGKRGQHHSHLEYDQTLNQLLVEMDGIQIYDEVRILVAAASNRADLLDPALLRPGRFDRTVRVDLPDREGRLQILKLHTRNKPLGASVRLEEVARETFGFSGAHLESVCNEAAIQAMRDRSLQIEERHFKDAVDKVMLGEKLERVIRPEEIGRVAIHESGHALVSEWVNPGSVASVTITPRGMALGFVRQAPDADRLLQTVSELRGEIRICLAGSAAERLLLEQASTGAANDFEKAWEVARRMVLAGLSPLGVVQEEALSPESLYGAVQEIIRQEIELVDAFLAAQTAVLRRLADQLLEAETLSGAMVREMLTAA